MPARTIPGRKSPDRYKALVLSGPLALAGVVAVAWSGARLGATPAPGAEAASAHATAHGSHAGELLTPRTISVRVRFSTALRELAGPSALNVTLQERASVGSLLNRLSEQYPVLAMMGPSVMVAVGDEMQFPETILRDGEVVDLVSSMAGG